jgi:NTP pyrophosphatase (non-canonical NTP hydrolase)
MDFKKYQTEAEKTIQKFHSEKSTNEIIPFLGIIGEAGSVISEIKKKLRDGTSYNNFHSKLKEELGDVLWYISAIASQQNLDLEEIAEKNLRKIKDRFTDTDEVSYINFDENFPSNESFPEEFEIEFVPYEEENRKLVKIINKNTGNLIGDPLTDNNREDDGYRFHDIFHYGYLANLGWSPVIRKLLKLKRKSDPVIDENEDGARAQIVEELISLLIYSHSQDHNLLKYSHSIDSDVLSKVKELTKNLEVKSCTAKMWEKAILNSYQVFNELVENNGGRVLVSKKNRKLIYLGNK